MSWIEQRPHADEVLSELGKLVRDNKNAAVSGLEKHLYWSDSTTSAGLARLSVTTGSARAFVGTVSQVSAGEAGALMLTSDTTRLYGLTSTDSFLLGSRRALLRDRTPGAASTGTVANNTRILVQSGVSTGLGSGTVALPFSPNYIASPSLTVTPIGTSSYTQIFQAAVTSMAFSGASVQLAYIGDASEEPACGFFWLAEGRAVL